MLALNGLTQRSQNLLARFFGSVNDRKIKPKLPLVTRINQLEPEFEKKSNDEVRALTAVFKQRLANGETLDDLLPEAFAAVREAAKRTLGQRHFDVQLIGGIMLHEGRISEMKTGEGKTLVATLPVYLNALSEKGVHVVTVNDYLAKRDSEWMGQVYNFLGLIDRRDRARADRRGAAPGLPLGCDLRHEQRVRLRLSARQHEVFARRDGSARPPLRDRGRSRLHPDRRSAHAADHLGPDRGQFRSLQEGRQPHSQSGEGGLRARREAAPGVAHRGRQRAHGAAAARSRRARRRRPLRRQQHRHGSPREPGADERTSCSRRTRTTSSRTTRSSSSTSSPAA